MIFAALAGYFIGDGQTESASIPETDGAVSEPINSNTESGREAMAALGMPVPPEPVPPPYRPSDEDAMDALGMPAPSDSDAAQGGGAITDPNAAAAAAERAKDIPNEEMTVTASRTLPKVRGFTDQTFVLMHMLNLVNLRNEFFELEGVEPSEDGDILTNTVRSLKHEIPFAYLPTDSNPKEQNAIIQCYGEPATFKNYLTAQPGYQKYLDAPTETLSSLVPKIRIYKLFGKPDKGYLGDTGQGEQLVEFAFETSGMGNADLQDLLASRGAKRGYGVGIKSFDFSFLEGNVMLAPTSVQGTLVLYAGSMEDLLRPRKGNTYSSSHLSYRFIELAFRATGESVLNSEVPSPKLGSIDDFNYRLVFDVGVVANANALGLESDYSSVSMKLGPTGYNFDIAQDGSITLTVELDGFIETRYRNTVNFDILSTPEMVTHRLYRDFSSAAIKQSCGGKGTREFNNKSVAIGNAQYNQRLTLLNDLLRAKGKIYYINIPPKTLEAYNEAFNAYEKSASDQQTVRQLLKDGKVMDPLTASKIKAGFEALKNALSPYVADDDADGAAPRTKDFSISNSLTNEKKAKQIEKNMEDKPKEEQSAIRDCAINPNSTQVAYFYVGDLLNVMLENMSDVYTKDNITTMVEDAIKAALEDTPLENLDAINSKVVGVAKDLNARAEDFKHYRAVLGPTLLQDFFSDQKIMCSIGDIPIALNHFNAWLAGLSGDALSGGYSLFDFMEEFLTKYLRSFLMGDTRYFDQTSLGSLYEFKSDMQLGFGSNSPEYDTDPLTLHRTSYGGRKGLLYETIPGVDRPLIRTRPNIFLGKRKSKAYDYHIFYDSKGEFCLPKTPAHMENSGINLFQQGKNRGIVKTIEFQKHDMETVKTSRIKEAFREGVGQTASQIMEMFDATVTTFPHLQAFIGERLYIAPQSITPYLSKESLETFPNFKGLYNLDRLGIGGFYTINQVRHSFGPGKMETNIIAIQDARYMADRREEARLKEQQAAAEAELEAAKKAAKDQKLSELGGIFSDDLSGALDALSTGTSAPLEAAKNQGITSEPQSAENACKTAFGEGPEGPRSATRLQAESFSGLVARANPEKFMALAKGLLDNAPIGSSMRSEIERILGVSGEEATNIAGDKSPTKGNQKTSNNGPVSTE